MGKDKPDDDEDDLDLPPLGEGTVEALEQAKKGKGRNFLLVCKGVKIKYLLVRKKAIKKKDVGDAKSQGYKGAPFFGVITGKGMDLVFNLARSDGYEAPPTKDKSLKDFLDEHAELKSKPTFAIVDQPPALPFDDEDLAHPLVARFLKLEETISDVLDRRPELQGTISNLVGEIRGLLQDQDYQPAESTLNKLTALLDASATGPVAGTGESGNREPAESREGAPTVTGNPNEFKQALAALKPELDVMIKNKLGDVSVYQNGMALIKERAEAKDFAGAVAACQNLQEHLRSEWNQRLERILPAVKELLSRPFQEQTGDVDKIRSVLTFAQGRAKEQRYGSAVLSLNAVHQLLEQAAAPGATRASDVIPENVVADRKQFLQARWQQTVNEIQVQVGKLQQAMADADENPGELAGAIQKELDSFCDKLADAVVGAQSASSQNLTPLQTARKVVGDYRKQISTHPFMQHLKQAPQALGTDADIVGTLQRTLDDLENRLAG